MSQELPTQSKSFKDDLEELSSNFDLIFDQVADNTPETVVELIARQLDRANEAAARIVAEGSVVRDMKGSVIAHPAIAIELAATKLAADLLGKHKA